MKTASLIPRRLMNGSITFGYGLTSIALSFRLLRLSVGAVLTFTHLAGVAFLLSKLLALMVKAQSIAGDWIDLTIWMSTMT